MTRRDGDCDVDNESVVYYDGEVDGVVYGFVFVTFTVTITRRVDNAPWR